MGSELFETWNFRDISALPHGAFSKPAVSEYGKRIRMP
jgi:hypothetical protein